MTVRIVGGGGSIKNMCHTCQRALEDEFEAKERASKDVMVRTPAIPERLQLSSEAFFAA